jgi:hypothetical protein
MSVSLDDFYVYLPKCQYYYKPTGERWTKAGVNAALKPVRVPLGKTGHHYLMKASDWLAKHRGVLEHPKARP